MTVPSFSPVSALSVTDRAVYGPVVQDNSLRLFSVTVFSNLSLVLVCGSVHPLSGR